MEVPATVSTKPSKKAEPESSSSEEEFEVDRDEDGNIKIFKRLVSEDEEEIDQEDELYESFTSRKKTTQIDMALAALKTALFDAEDHHVKVEFMKKQFAE